MLAPASLRPLSESGSSTTTPSGSVSVLPAPSGLIASSESVGLAAGGSSRFLVILSVCGQVSQAERDRGESVNPFHVRDSLGLHLAQGAR